MVTEYIMKNKDNNVFSFLVNDSKDEVVKITTINNEFKNLEPAFIKTIKEIVHKRRFSSGRMYAEELMNTYGNNNLFSYIDAGLGLSLNDTSWFVPADKDYKWEDYNFYQNEFDRNVTDTALFGKKYHKSGIIMSPEFTTAGMLKKAWVRDDTGIKLYKGGTEVYANGGKEAYAEYYASQLLELLGLNHVHYDLVKLNGEVFCSCLSFTDEKVGFTPTSSLLERESIEKYGLENFEDLMFFDGFIGNLDRHKGNWGVLFENDTNEIIGAAPIFDNGFNYLNLLTLDEYDNFSERNYLTFDRKKPLEQAKEYFRDRHIEGLERIVSASFEQPEFNEFEKYTRKFEEFIKRRSENILEQSLSPYL